MASVKKKPAAKTKAKAPAKAAAKKMVAKKTVAKKTVAKKTTLKKPIAKKAIAKKQVVKKTAAKPAAKKHVAQKKIIKKPIAKAVAVKAAAKKPVVKNAASKKVAPPPYTPPVRAVNGIPEQMLDAALKILDERQAEDIVTIELAGRSSVADYMIIASGRAARQVSAIADYLREAFYKVGAERVRIEGMNEANWVLIDAGDIIVHLFRPEVRSYYNIDAIWSTTRTASK